MTQQMQANSHNRTVCPDFARRERLEDAFSTISVGGVMRAYQTGGVAAPEAPAQPSEGQAGSGGAPVVTAAGPAAGGEEMVSFPLSAFNGVDVNPRDIGNIVAMLKTQESYRRDGFIDLIDSARQHKQSGYGLRTAMEENDWKLNAPAAEPPPPPPANPGYEPPPQQQQLMQDPATGQWYDPSTGQFVQQQQGYGDPRLDAMIETLQKQNAMIETLQKGQTNISEQRTQEAEQFEAQRIWAERATAEQTAIARGLKAAGIERNVVEGQFYGQAREFDEAYDFEHSPGIKARASALWERDIHPQDEAGRQEFTDGLPIPAQYIDTVMAGYGANKTVQDLSTAAQVADTHRVENLPEGALPAGPGGQAAKAVETEDDRMEAAFTNAQAAGQLRGKYD